MAEPKTKGVKEGEEKNYLQKAEECERAMKTALEGGDHNAAAINAVHCGISAADALTTASLGVRHAGQSHQDVQRLLKQIQDPDIGKVTRHLTDLLRIKGTAEYESRLITPSEAKNAVTHAERLLSWVRKKVAPE